MVSGFIQPAAAHQYHTLEEIPLRIASVTGNTVQNLFRIGNTIGGDQPTDIRKRGTAGIVAITIISIVVAAVTAAAVSAAGSTFFTLLQ